MNKINNEYSEIGNRDKKVGRLVNPINQSKFEMTYKEKSKSNNKSNEYKNHQITDEKQLVKENKFDKLMDDYTIGYSLQHPYGNDLTFKNVGLDGAQVRSTIDAVEVITEILNKVSFSNVENTNIFKTIISLPNVGDLKLEICKKKNAESFVKIKKTQSKNSLSDVELNELMGYLVDKGVDCSVG